MAPRRYRAAGDGDGLQLPQAAPANASRRQCGPHISRIPGTFGIHRAAVNNHPARGASHCAADARAAARPVSINGTAIDVDGAHCHLCLFGKVRADSGGPVSAPGRQGTAAADGQRTARRNVDSRVHTAALDRICPLQGQVQRGVIFQLDSGVNQTRVDIIAIRQLDA